MTELLILKYLSLLNFHRVLHEKDSLTGAAVSIFSTALVWVDRVVVWDEQTGLRA